MKIVVYGDPVAKGRPQIAMRGRYPAIFTPKKTREAEDTFMQQAIKQKPEKPLEGPLYVSICFFKKKPKSYSKKIKYWDRKPDIDNLIKLVLDAMNKVFFNDDSQIIQITASKKYDEVSRTEIIIRGIVENEK